MKISVIIPCYNSEKTIEACVQSVFNQSEPVSEIIIVDDGSIDDSKAKIKNLINSNLDKNIKFYEQKNSGPSKARNLGIENASGNWIAFLDSDDVWFEDKIEKQLQFLNKFPEVVICSTANSKLFFKPEIPFTIINFKKSLFKNYFETSTVMVKTEVIKEVMFHEPQKYSEDYRAWLTILSNNFEGLYINSFLTKSIENKASFGESGLSKNLLGIEKGEWQNFQYLLKTNKISYSDYLLAISYSTLKFVRRFILTKIR